MGCTAIGVTPGASADGSSLISHTSDCATCDGRVAFVAARDWPQGSKRPVYPQRAFYPRYVAPDRSPTYAPEDGQDLDTPQGYIPQVPHTYAYWESAYGYMNEHGLAISESTCAALFVNLQGDAMFPIRELTQVAQERCKTARCAAETAGWLAETYGFYGEDPGQPGAGETLIFGDGREVWMWHVCGDPTGKSAFWAAAKVPDGHVAMSANNFAIREVDCDDHEKYMCSTGLYEKAKAAGAWSGVGPFDWSMTMGPDIRNFSYTPGFEPIPFYTSARLWRIFDRVAPSQGVALVANPWDYPWSAPVDERLTARNVMDLMRDHYEGTEIDLTVGVFAGPYGSPNRNQGGVGLKTHGGQFARAMSLPRTSSTSIGQTYPPEGATERKGITTWWFSQDAPASSVFVPFYANTSRYDRSFGIGHMSKYDDRSAWWVFDFVANWMELNYRLMSIDVNAKLTELQDLIDQQRKPVEARALALSHSGDVDGAQALLAEFQEGLQKHVVDTWRQFGHFLIMKYNDGFLNYPEIAQSIGYPYWWLQMLNLTDDLRPQWALPSGTPPTAYTELGPGPFEVIDQSPAVAVAAAPAATPLEAGRATVPARAAAAVVALVGALTFLAGVGFGKQLERRSVERKVGLLIDGAEPWGTSPYFAVPRP